MISSISLLFTHVRDDIPEDQWLSPVAYRFEQALGKRKKEIQKVLWQAAFAVGYVTIIALSSWLYYRH